MLDNAEFINVSSCTYERVEDTGRATVRAAARATACLIGKAPTLTRTTTLLRLVKKRALAPLDLAGETGRTIRAREWCQTRWCLRVPAPFPNGAC
jgi:hypothetical protein